MQVTMFVMLINVAERTFRCEACLPGKQFWHVQMAKVAICPIPTHLQLLIIGVQSHSNLQVAMGERGKLLPGVAGLRC